ncbi:MAG: hypothetical protein FWE22_01690 [Firmicutes bacterium]|nr:hypothetical protein [Bacillota bacterium]
MKTKQFSIKRNILIAAFAALISVLIALSFSIVFNNNRAINATASGEISTPDANVTVWNIVLNINGVANPDVESVRGSSFVPGSVIYNNGAGINPARFRERTLTSSLFTDNDALGVEVGVFENCSTGTLQVYNTFGNFFSIVPTGDSTNGHFTITAHRRIDSATARILVGAGSNRRAHYLHIEVTNAFEITNFYVGHSVGSSLYTIPVRNFESFSFDFNQRLLNRNLFEDFNEAGFVDQILEGGVSSPSRQISSLQGLRVTAVRMRSFNNQYFFGGPAPNNTNEFVDVSSQFRADGTPSLYMGFNLNNSVLSVAGDNREDLWFSENFRNIHVMEIVMNFDGIGSFTAKYLIRFIQQTVPSALNPFRVATRLNAGIERSDPNHTFSNPTDNPNLPGRSFWQTRVYVRSLVVFYGIEDARFCDVNPWEAPSDDDGAYSRIEISGPYLDAFGEEFILVSSADPVEVDLNLIEGPAPVRFRIVFPRVDEGSGSISRPSNLYTVNFQVYGIHSVDRITVYRSSIDMDVSGITPLAEFVRRNYRLDSVEIDDAYSITAQVIRNHRTISFRNAVDGESVEATFVFTNMEGRTIRAPGTIVVNFGYNNWWAGLQSWQRVLYIVLLAVIILLLILFFVFLFLRGLMRARREEQEAVVPQSAYLVKLNQTIAAAQAQRRMTQTTHSHVQLNPAVSRDMSNSSHNYDVTHNTNIYRIGAGGQHPASGTTTTTDTQMLSSGVSHGHSHGYGYQQPINSYAHTRMEDIYIPITDEELLERIYKEKYAPRGMTERSFEKSRDLQDRELEKEKNRIRELIKAGVPVDEACKSEKQLEAEREAIMFGENQNSGVMGSSTTAIIHILGFDPLAPTVSEEEFEKDTTSSSPQMIVDEFGEERLVFDEMMPEDTAFNEAQRELKRQQKILAELAKRDEKIDEAVANYENMVKAKQDELGQLDDDIRSLTEKSADLDVLIASSRGKEREKYIKEREIVEEQLGNAKKKRDQIANELNECEPILEELKKVQEQNKKDIAAAQTALVVAERELKKAEKAAKAAKEARINGQLYTMLESVARVDRDLSEANKKIADLTEKKGEARDEISRLQTKLLSTTDPEEIAAINAQIEAKNNQIKDIDRELERLSKVKKDKERELTAGVRQSNDFVIKNKVPYETVVRLEDEALKVVAAENASRVAKEELERAKVAFEESQRKYEKLIADIDDELAAAQNALNEQLKIIEEEAEALKNQLEMIDAEMENATEEEKLDLMLKRMELAEQLEQKQREAEEKREEGIKKNLEKKAELDEKLKDAEERMENAKRALDNAEEDYKMALQKSSEDSQATFIPSGSGIVSQERLGQEIEEARSRYNRATDEVEKAEHYARLTALQAHKAALEAERATDANREKLEERAKDAQREADKARADYEAIKLAKEREEQLRKERLAEAEREAELRERELKVREAALATEREEEKLKAEQRALRIAGLEEEEALTEAEAIRKAEREAEMARQQVEKDAEISRQQAELDAKKTMLDAEGEAAKMMREAEVEAAKLRREAEEEAAKLAREQGIVAGAPSATDSDKIARRKHEILTKREKLKDIKTEKEGLDLKEDFVNTQMRFDDEEKTNLDLALLIERSIADAQLAAERAKYNELANKEKEVVERVVEKEKLVEKDSKPYEKKYTKKVVERVNKIHREVPSGKKNVKKVPRPASAGGRPKPGSKTRPGTRPARPGARPVRPGTRPARPGAARRPGSKAGAARRPGAAKRPGARPARPGARPVRPGSAKPRR